MKLRIKPPQRNSTSHNRYEKISQLINENCGTDAKLNAALNLVIFLNPGHLLRTPEQFATDGKSYETNALLEMARVNYETAGRLAIFLASDQNTISQYFESCLRTTRNEPLREIYRTLSSRVAEITAIANGINQSVQSVSTTKNEPVTIS